VIRILFPRCTFEPEHRGPQLSPMSICVEPNGRIWVRSLGGWVFQLADASERQLQRLHLRWRPESRNHWASVA